MGNLTFSGACLVLCRNGVADGLARCLESIRAAGLEPWLLDDESTDDTFLVGKKYGARYRYHSASGLRKEAIWQTHEDVLRGVLTDWVLSASKCDILATLDADEWFMSPLTTGQIAREMIKFGRLDGVFMRTVNFWNDEKHYKVFPSDPNYARPRLWRVDRTKNNTPHANTMGVQAPLYAHEGRIACNWNLCVGHTGYVLKDRRMAKSKRYRELGAGSWAAAIASDDRVFAWDPETLRGLP